MPPRAVVFDFNGTLSDDEPVLCEIFVELFAEHGKPLSAQEYFDHLAGYSDPANVHRWLGPDHPANVQDAMTRQMSAERTRRAVVTEAEGTKQAAVTVAEGEKQAAILNAEGQRQAAILRAEGFSLALETIFKGVGWFIICEMIVLVLLIAFPGISLVLPRLMR